MAGILLNRPSKRQPERYPRIAYYTMVLQAYIITPSVCQSGLGREVKTSTAASHAVPLTYFRRLRQEALSFKSG
jgi:hypothetical protein